jgi:signal transduction histidine kinase/serine phosphatase RsbU (regulator of sigma subunit)/FixJ family two-component response regulator
MNGPNEDQRSAAARAFAEGGPVGALMSGVDWAAGPLGPPGKWPQRLVETVRIMLSAEQPMALFWGPEFVLLYNEGYAAVIGSKHPRGVGARARDIFPEAWDDTTGQLFRRLVAQRRALLTNDWEFRLERYGFLEQAYFDISFQPVLMDDGTVGGVLCIVTETTDRVLGERRLRLLTEIGSRTAGLPTPQDVARAVAEVLAAHAEDVPFGCVYLASEQGELRLAGTAGSPGLAPEIVRPDSYGDQVAGHLARVLRKGVPVELPAAGFSEEASGEQRVLALPLPCAGRPAGVLVAGVNPHLPASGAYRDFFDVLVSGIAAALSAALAQEEQRRRAEELDRAKTAFFSNVSHEFRTPLTLFLGPVQEALAEEDRPERRARLELAERNALRLLKLVNALLDVSRAEAGQLHGSFQPVDLSRTTAELAGVFRAVFDTAGLTLEVDCPPLPEPVHVDREMWEKIVLNLIGNALKFTFTGGARVRTSAAGGRARFTVADTGTGIPEDEVPHLFERFHQVHGARSRSHEGSGIGLSLVKDLVELHGGTITVDSVPGRGTEFTVEIPFGSGHLPPGPAAGATDSTQDRTTTYADEAMAWLVDDVPKPVTEPVTEAVTEAERKTRLLVADDNADMRSYLLQLLSPEHDVLLAPDGETALRTALTDSVDLVLTDATMPGLDGFGLVKALRADHRTAGLPVIMLTAQAGEEAAVQGLRAGADDYLAKPFSARQLRARVHANLELTRMRERVLEESRQHLGMLASLTEAGLRLAATLDPGEVLETAGDLLIPALADWMEIRLDDQGPSYTAGTRKPEETALSLPLVSQDQALGTLTVARHEGGHSRSERRYLEDLAARLALAYDNAVRYQNERRLALTLQRALLPQQLPQAPGLRIATYYRASSHGTEIGGDWYDVIALPGGCVGLAIGDVMGHDVDAATVMGRLRPALHGFALDTPDPARVLARLDTYLRSLDVEPFATCLYARYDAATHRLQYASSGHLPPLLVAGARTCFLKLCPGPPLGVGLGAAVNHETDLPPGAGLLLFTDGLVESRTLPISTGLAALRRTCRTLAVATPDDPQRIIDRALELLDAPGRVEDDTALLAATARSCGEAEHG